MIQRTIAVIALTVAPAVFAQTYIVPEGDCGEQTLHVRGNAISADRVASAYVYQPKRRIEVKPVAGSQSLDFKAAVAEGDVVMVGVEFKPMAVGDETWTSHAKALLFCGKEAPMADWMRTADLGLDIVPQGWNPLRMHMKAGDTLRFIAVEKSPAGKYDFLKDLPMELRRSNGDLIATGTPADGGGMNFSFPEPGTYFVLTTHRRPDPAAAGHSLVDTSTLAFVVK